MNTYTFNKTVRYVLYDNSEYSRDKKTYGSFEIDFKTQAISLENAILYNFLNHCCSTNQYINQIHNSWKYDIETDVTDGIKIWHIFFTFNKDTFRYENLKIEDKHIEQKKQKKERSKKKHITKKLRESVWVKRNKESINGNCYCCSGNITVFNFEVGHIVAESKGGSTTLSNLEPICMTCNRGMSVKNMNDYKATLTK